MGVQRKARCVLCIIKKIKIKKPSLLGDEVGVSGGAEEGEVSVVRAVGGDDAADNRVARQVHAHLYIYILVYCVYIYIYIYII